MNIFQNITEYASPILSGGFLIFVLNHIIGAFSNRSSRKIKHSIIKTELYSPVVQFMTSIDFLNYELDEVMEYIERTLYKKYDYIYPNDIILVLKLKAKIVKDGIKEVSTKEFSNLYFSIQFEYNKAKRDASLDYDSRYTNTDIKIYTRFSFIIFAIYASINVIVSIRGLISGPTNFDFLKRLTYMVGFLTLGLVILAGIWFGINSFITRRGVLREWEGLLVKKPVKPNGKEGESK